MKSLVLLEHFKISGYFVFNNIPVTDEGRPVFEHRFTERAGAIESELGFIAFRLLRPLDSDTYIVMTEWSESTYYTRWKNSSSFDKAHSSNRRRRRRRQYATYFLERSLCNDLYHER